MSRHQKELTKKQKIIIYVSCAAAAVVAAVGAVFLIIHLVKNPPSVIFNSNSASYISNLSTLSAYDEVFVPEATIIVTDDGTQEKVDKIIEAADQVTPTRKNKIIVQNYKVDKSGFIKTKVNLPVEFLSQYPELPTGCEITALTTVLNFYGYDVSKTDMSDKYLDKTIDQIGDFYEVYVGNPRKNGFGCYAKAIVNAANRYLATTNGAYKAVDYSGTKFENLLKLVEADTPVIIWGTMYGETEKTLIEPYTTVQWNINGKDMQWIAPEHCMVLIGYDLDRNVAIISDPQRGIVEYDLDTVKARYLALQSQCVVLEEIPVITGVQDGATYYTTQVVSVADYNLESVTLNGQKCETTFLIPGNVDDVYKIVVTSLDGDVTTITVYTKPVISLLDPIDGITEYNVTLANKETIQAIKNTVLSLSTDYSAPKERSAHEDVIATCDVLLDRITTVLKEVERIKTLTSSYDGKDISEIDSGILTKIIEDIRALNTCKNLTQEQQNEISAIYTKCNQWLSEKENNTSAQ